MTRKQILAKCGRDVRSKLNRRRRALERSARGYEQSYTRSTGKKKRASRITKARRRHKDGPWDTGAPPPQVNSPQEGPANHGRPGEDSQSDPSGGQ